MTTCVFQCSVIGRSGDLGVFVNHLVICGNFLKIGGYGTIMNDCRERIRVELIFFFEKPKNQLQLIMNGPIKSVGEYFACFVVLLWA